MKKQLANESICRSCELQKGHLLRDAVVGPAAEGERLLLGLADELEGSFGFIGYVVLFPQEGGSFVESILGVGRPAGEPRWLILADIIWRHNLFLPFADCATQRLAPLAGAGSNKVYIINV